MQGLKDKIVAIITVIGVTILGMAGGQGKVGGKGTRRFGVPGLAILASLLTQKVEWRDFVFVLAVPVLITGYGENSWLLSVFKVEWIVRMVYAAMFSVPFLFYGLWRWVVALGALIIAFQVRAGSLGYLPWFGDVLIEDAIRYSVFGILVAYQFLFPRKS